MSFLLLVSITSAQQVRRIDDNVLKNAGKTGEEWLTYGFTPSAHAGGVSGN